MGKRKQKKALTRPDFCDIPGCFWGVVLQRHRIFPGRDGGAYTPENVSWLCPSHHICADRGLEDPDNENWFRPEFLQELTNSRLLRRTKDDE